MRMWTTKCSLLIALCSNFKRSILKPVESRCQVFVFDSASKNVRLLLLCNWMDYFFIVFNLYIVFVIVHFLKSIFTFVYHSASFMECIQNQELSSVNLNWHLYVLRGTFMIYISNTRRMWLLVFFNWFQHHGPYTRLYMPYILAYKPTLNCL